MSLPPLPRTRGGEEGGASNVIRGWRGQSSIHDRRAPSPSNPRIKSGEGDNNMAGANLIEHTIARSSSPSLLDRALLDKGY
jgi:hypothetical protein